MLKLIEKVNNLAKQADNFNLNSLFQLLRQEDISNLEFETHLPPLNGNSYTKTIVQLKPVEFALLRWPPGCESAIHHHEGFFGYVAVLSGTAVNRNFKLNEGLLTETQRVTCNRGAFFAEADGDIHKIENPAQEELITLHIYYPPLEDLNNLKLFKEDGSLAVLNATAASADWIQPKSAYSKIEPNSFQFKPFENQPSSHFINFELPKPSSQQTHKNLLAYYSEQASNYDQLDKDVLKRNAYTSAINSKIGKILHGFPNLNRSLDIACGTGRRAVDIRNKSQSQYEIHGVDLNKEMCKMAATRLDKVSNSRFLDLDIPKSSYDVAMHLYAFGHLSSNEQRETAVKKIFDCLRPGGKLFLDVFNLDDEFEWGPKIAAEYKTLHLEHFGYKIGDVLYRRKLGEHATYLHYFKKSEIQSLLLTAGFEIEQIEFVGYGKDPGIDQLETDKGKLFIVAQKPN